MQSAGIGIKEGSLTARLSRTGWATQRKKRGRSLYPFTHARPQPPWSRSLDMRRLRVAEMVASAAPLWGVALSAITSDLSSEVSPDSVTSLSTKRLPVSFM